jgi:hypothetical protein
MAANNFFFDAVFRRESLAPYRIRLDFKQDAGWSRDDQT